VPWRVVVEPAPERRRLVVVTVYEVVKLLHQYGLEPLAEFDLKPLLAA